jgi:transcriptional regulator with XRE-family HTH domain
MIYERKVSPFTQQRLKYIGMMLKEMRLAEGKNQDGFVEEGISRRAVQRAEYSNNLTLVKLFSMLDLYGYDLSDLECKEYQL